MKKAFLILAVALFITPLSGQTLGDQVQIRVSYNGEAITVSNTAIGFTSSLINPTCADCPVNVLRATLATCTVQTDAIRVRADGTNPTAAIGLYVASGQSFTVFGYNDIANFRAIRVTTDATIYCQYSRIQAGS